MGLRAVHYKDGTRTFLYEDGVQLVTDHQVQAEHLAEGNIPLNKHGVRVTSYISPNACCDLS
jgi:hypothetical protein